MTGLLEGKNVLITGVITEASMAFHTARIAIEQGATVVLTGFGRVSLVERIAKRLPGGGVPVVELDITNPEQVASLQRFGALIGTAFQISDDVIDITSPSDSSGKTPGTDLREGVPTLPVLYALDGDDTDASAVRLREILAIGPITDDALHAEALELLRESAAMKRARETVRAYAEEARVQLAPLPDGSPRQAMEALCDFIADRTS